MAKDLKKFVNPKFTRTVDLCLFHRLLDRYSEALDGLNVEQFVEGAGSEVARHAIQDFFAGPEENYPEGLIADLHRIAELGNANGLEIILEQATRLGVRLTAETEPNEPEVRQDPKHVALRVFLDHPNVFDAASDMMAMLARTSLGEFAGRDEGVEALMDKCAKAEFETAAAAIFEQDMRSTYCRVGWYNDADELVLVIAHGSPITATPIVKGDKEQIISLRSVEHAVLSYSSTTGLVKIGGVAKARRSDLAELFADKVLHRPGFFATENAQNLYTLDPIERAGFSFTFNHDFDPGIQRVEMTEVQVNRIGYNPRTRRPRTFHAYLARDYSGSALARLGDMMRRSPLGSDWRLNHIVIRVHFATGGTRAKKVTVKLKPPSRAIFKRQQFEGRIMILLRRNGLVRDRKPDAAAAAAE